MGDRSYSFAVRLIRNSMSIANPFHHLAYAVVFYCACAGPMTYYCMLFISKLIQNHRTVFAHNSSDEDVRNFDTVSKEVETISFAPLFINGWHAFPVSCFMLLLVLYVYVKNSILIAFKSTEIQ